MEMLHLDGFQELPLSYTISLNTALGYATVMNIL